MTVFVNHGIVDIKNQLPGTMIHQFSWNLTKATTLSFDLLAVNL